MLLSSAIGVMLLLITLEAIADEKKIAFGFSADYYGKYIWRGQNLVDDPVFQPGLSATYGGFTASIWGSLETTNYNDNAGDFTEVDYTLDYSVDVPGIEGLGFSVGVIYYDFPSTEVKDTTELYWGFSAALPLNPSITIYHDIDEADGGLYGSFALSHSIEDAFEIGSGTPVSIEIGASLGWGNSSYNDYYWGLNSSKTNDLAISVAFPFSMGGWTVSPSVNYVTLVDGDIREIDAYRTESDYLFAGIGLSTEF